MRALFDDFRYSLRTLRKSPLVTAVALVSLALGIGANTTIFTLLDQALLRSLPVHQPERLVMLRDEGPRLGFVWNSNTFSYPMYKDMRDKVPAFGGVVAHLPHPATVGHGGLFQRADLDLVSGNFFDVLGVKPAAGRLLTQADDLKPGAHPVAVLSYRYWQTRFAGSPALLNQTIQVNGMPMTVIGVAHEKFQGLAKDAVIDVWVPLAMKKTITPNWDEMNNRRAMFLLLFARLRDGVTLRQAQTAANVVWHQARAEEVKEFPARVPQSIKSEFLKYDLPVVPGGNGDLEFATRSEKPLWVLMGMVALVLLIACANVANLMIARATARQKELAVRIALGASRLHIFRQVLAEGMVLSFAGGALGVLLATWLGDALIALLFTEGPAPLRGTPDARVLAYTVALCLATGLLAGLFPAWRASQDAVAGTLKAESRGSSLGVGAVRARQVLVVAQVGLSLLLLIGAGLFVQSLRNLYGVNTGMRVGGLMTFAIDPSLSSYSTQRAHDYFERLRQRLAEVRGVRSVALVQSLPLTGNISSSTIRVEGYKEKERENMNPDFNEVSPNYFNTMGIPLLQGRDFTERDTLGAPKVAVVNEEFATYFFGQENPIGRRFGMRRSATADIEIIGVVKNHKSVRVKDELKRRLVYTPYLQNENPSQMAVVAQTDGPPTELSGKLQAEARAIDAALPIYEVRPMTRVVDTGLSNERLIASLALLFGGLATILAAVGLYGVLAYMVTRRAKEIGIRMALGAAPGRVVRSVLAEAGILAGIGIVVGVPSAVALGRMLESQLYGLKPGDPVIFAVATMVLGLVATLAGLVPAWRAAKLDPAIALRDE